MSRLQLKTKIQNLQQALSRNPIRNWVWLIFVAYMAKYLYVIFPYNTYEDLSRHPERLINFFPWRDDVDTMDARNYVYLIGERFFTMVLFFFLSRSIKCWQTFILWVMSVVYIFDFMIFMHDSVVTKLQGIILTIMFIPTFYRWIKS